MTKIIYSHDPCHCQWTIISHLKISKLEADGIGNNHIFMWVDCKKIEGKDEWKRCTHLTRKNAIDETVILFCFQINQNNITCKRCSENSEQQAEIKHSFV